MKNDPVYTNEPDDKQKFTDDFNKFYTNFAGIYNISVKLMPVWKTWIKGAVPHITGPRVLEVSFGTGYLLTQYADKFETYGIDYNAKMVSVAQKNLLKHNMSANLQKGDVASLPFEDGFFDCLVNTMAFSGYPDGMKAMSEMKRVLKKGGKLIMVDIDYPKDRNRMGMMMTRFWALAGDIIRDMDILFKNFDFNYKDIEIGGYGSVHLYLAEK